MFGGGFVENRDDPFRSSKGGEEGNSHNSTYIEAVDLIAYPSNPTTN